MPFSSSKQKRQHKKKKKTKAKLEEAVQLCRRERVGAKKLT